MGFGRADPKRTLPAPLRIRRFYRPRLGLIASAITGAAFVFLLALSLYSTGAAVVLGICMFIPLVGLIILLVVNGKATSVLREHGVHVGLLEAGMSDIPPR